MRVRYFHSDDGKIQKAGHIYERYEHGISRKDIDVNARKVISRLRHFGYPSYIVGGAVRDLFLGRSPKDYDVATAATPQVLRKIFRNSRIIGRRFRLVHIFFHSTIIEVTTFRSTDTSDGVWGTMYEDATRRDFSINALYFCPEEEIIIDYVNGVRDFKRKLLRPVIPVEIMFKEDPVRIIRALKYAALTDFTLPAVYRRRMRMSVHLLKNVPGERIAVELEKILRSGYCRAVMKNFIEYDAILSISPYMGELLKIHSDLAEPWLRQLAKIDAMLTQHDKDIPFSRILAFFMSTFIRTLIEDGQLMQDDDDISACIRRILEPVFYSGKIVLSTARHLSSKHFLSDL